MGSQWNDGQEFSTPTPSQWDPPSPDGSGGTEWGSGGYPQDQAGAWSSPAPDQYPPAGYHPQYGAYPPQGDVGAGAWPITGMQEHPHAITVLVLAIVGFLITFTWPVGWFVGHQAKKSIENGAPYRWGGVLVAGYWINLVMTVITILSVIGGLAFFIFFILVASGG